jgi:hypothetical protein
VSISTATVLKFQKLNALLNMDHNNDMNFNKDWGTQWGDIKSFQGRIQLLKANSLFKNFQRKKS